MFFLISKLFWLVFAPSHLVGFLAIAAAICLWMGRFELGRKLAVATAVLFVLIGFLPTWMLLMRPIEDRYARPAWPAHVDGILILGAGAHPETLRARGALAPEWSDPRFVGAFELARHYPNARVIFSGGSGDVTGGIEFSEATAARHIFTQLGLDPARVTYEGKSHNTWENIAFSRAIAKPRNGETWVLAVSAFQMPRAMLAARRQGWTLVAWPTDYMTPRDTVHTLFDVTQNLTMFEIASHEWLGLLAYDLK